MRRHNARSVVDVGVLQTGVDPEDGHGAGLYAATGVVPATAPVPVQLRAMPRASSNGIELEYETFGDPADPALLLVMGFTAQMTAWDDEFCELLADRGRFVIRFDNRDCGLSTHLDGARSTSTRS